MAAGITRTKLFSFLGLIFVLTVAIVIFIVQYQTNGIVSDLTRVRVQLANHNLASYLHELEVRVVLRAEVIAGDETVITNIKNKNYESLKRYLENFTLGMDFTSICNPHGIVLARSLNDKTGDDVSIYRGVQETINTGLTSTSMEQIVSNENRLSIFASVPIYDNGDFIGIVNCNYDLTNNEYMDEFKERTGCEATIFLHDERISTTLRDESGHRLVGTKAYDFIVESVIEQKKEYVGNLNIYGKMYGVCYNPLVNYGKTIGMLFTGVDIDRTLAHQRSMNLWIILAAFVGILASTAFIIISNRIMGKIENASRSKSIFLSNMSHEMRTPMNAIIGMTDIARNTTDIERKDYALRKVDEASKHLLGIINDVLDMSKIEANKFELSHVEVDLRELMQKAASFVHFNMELKHQKFNMKVGKNIPSYYYGDDQRLTQVITNLLSNAVKFTPEEGQISLSASLVHEDENKLCTLRFEVTDSGIGIPLEQQKKIFLMFEQAESGTTRKFGGTGLGLSISRHIVEIMHGEIHVESRLGKGSSFIFTVKIPRIDKLTEDHKVGSKGTTYADTHNNEFAGKKILLAEDVEINREIIISMLEGTGIIIETAENGIEAFEKYVAAPYSYDLIFMDMQMPEMDGLESTIKIRKYEKDQLLTQSVPIIAMTANVFKEDIDNCIAAGMDNHIGKPIDINPVLEMLHKYIKTES
jgi:signal transduction histidine kinase/ActR/RegA family two-component response regulator